MKPLGLYLHIPFCKRKCLYCDFCSLPACGDAVMDTYCAALMHQLEQQAACCRNHCVDTVYFGGGTPSYFGAERLCTLLEALRQHYTLAPDAEITLEANPDSAEPDFLRRVRAAGFNRISFGVQSFDDRELQLIGRVHNARQARLAILDARDAGFDNLSLDLIYGLPEQSMSSWQQTLEAAVSLPVCHISAYGLRPEEGTPLASSPLLDRLPDDDAQADQYLFAVEFLRTYGFFQYEISNFAVPGRESRHNKKYWRLEEYLGLGAAAHSDFGGVRFGTVADVDAYMAGVRTGMPLLSEQEQPGEAERQRERTMLALRTAEGLPLNTEPKRRLARQLQTHGLARLEGDRICLTPEGFLLSNRIIGDFWALDEI